LIQFILADGQLCLSGMRCLKGQKGQQALWVATVVTVCTD